MTVIPLITDTLDIVLPVLFAIVDELKIKLPYRPQCFETYLNTFNIEIYKIAGNSIFNVTRSLLICTGYHIVKSNKSEIKSYVLADDEKGIIFSVNI